MMNIKIKKFRHDAKLPTKAHLSDGGWDFYANDLEIKDDGRHIVSLGVGMEIPEGYMLCLVPRSSISKSGWILANSFGVIDSSYRGEVKAVFRQLVEMEESGGNYHNPTVQQVFKQQKWPFKFGERCVQGFLLPVLDIKWDQVDKLNDTERGSGGFGSSGKN